MASACARMLVPAAVADESANVSRRMRVLGVSASPSARQRVAAADSVAGLWTARKQEGPLSETPASGYREKLGAQPTAGVGGGPRRGCHEEIPAKA